jgi:hypothetical protein
MLAGPRIADQSPIGGLGLSTHWFTLNKIGRTALRRCNIGCYRVVRARVSGPNGARLLE